MNTPREILQDCLDWLVTRKNIAYTHMVRYVLTVLVMFWGVWPEVGPWTFFMLSMITLNIEVEFYIRHPEHWQLDEDPPILPRQR